MMQDDFITQYLEYVGETECPLFYHRWCCISMIGAYLGRQYSFNLGHFELHPNKYIMLIGSPGTRKSTAIKIAKGVLVNSGYSFMSADKSSKEKFMLDLAGEEKDDVSVDDILDKNLWGSGSLDGEGQSAAEMYIACDEFNTFIGNGNIEFISLLGDLWDYNGIFKNRIKTGKSVSISNPTISILGGNTPVNFSRAFPPEIIGQGFFSRLLLIHGEPTGKRITFPPKPSIAATNSIVSALQRIKMTCMGNAELTETASKLLDKIYKTWGGIDDFRFESYANRRFTHLLKLCLIVSAAYYSNNITEQHVIYAHTVLTHTEHLMPKALGEFGKSRNSDITQKVMQILNGTEVVLNMKDLWEHVHKDLEKPADLGDLLRNLALAGKIQGVDGGYLPNKKVIEQVDSDVLNYSILTDEEKEMSK